MTSPTFAEAQQRLLARRAAREAGLGSSSATSSTTPQPASALSRRGWALWSAVAGPPGGRAPFRVGQLDASFLDEELVALLRGHVTDGLRHLSNRALSQDWAAEIELALRAVIFKLTVWDRDASYGAALQNLRYSDARQRGGLAGGAGGLVFVPPSRWQKGAYGLVTVLGRYGWDRWEGWLSVRDEGYTAGRQDEEGAAAAATPAAERSRRWVRMLARLTDAARTAHAAAAVVSFLAFLLRGRYRTLLDRILRMRLVPRTGQVSREVSFEYQNRQLVWHAFTEFLLFVLPLLGISGWRRWAGRAWRRTKAAAGAGALASSSSSKPAGEYSFLPERTCAICYRDQNAAASSTENEMMAVAAAAGGVVGSAATDVTSPYEAVPCGCIYCFVCIANCLEGEEGGAWTCLRCGGPVRECRPWGGDVLVERGGREGGAREAGSRAVAFEGEGRPGGDGEGEGGDEDGDEDGVGGSLQLIDAVPLEDDGL